MVSKHVKNTHLLVRSFLHFFQNSNDLFERGPFSRVFIHANSDQLGHVLRNSWRNLNSKALSSNLKNKNKSVNTISDTSSIQRLC